MAENFSKTTAKPGKLPPGFELSSDDEEIGESEYNTKKKFEEDLLAFKHHQTLAKAREMELENHKKLLESKLKDDQPFMKKSFTLKVYLCNIRPLVWRRIKVPGTMNIQAFVDQVLDPAMGWCRGYHGYCVYTGTKNNLSNLGLVYGPVESNANDMEHCGSRGIIFYDDRLVTVGQLLQKVGDRIVWVHDLGDWFKHKIVVESVADTDDKPEEIAILDGAKACPPEDFGSAYQYAEDMAILRAGKKHPGYKALKNKLLNPPTPNCVDPEEFDPDFFDLKEHQKRLSHVLTLPVVVKQNRERVKFMNPMFGVEMEHEIPKFTYNEHRKDGNKVLDFMTHQMKLRSQGGGGHSHSHAHGSGGHSHSHGHSHGHGESCSDDETPQPPKTNGCVVCGAPSEMRCGKCKAVYYCGKDHQKQDWKTHKLQCK